MGKRELVLISIFVALGILVYQFTAPPPLPGSEGISISGIFRHMQRGIHGARASATADFRLDVPIDASVTELRVTLPRMSDLTVAGEDRTDLAAEMHTTARGFDQAEAKGSADAARLKIERVGTAIVVSLDTSAERALPLKNGPRQVAIVLTVPRRLALRMEPHIGRLVVSSLAAADVMGSRGDTRVSGISGRVALTHVAGALDVDHIGSLKLNARNSRGSVKHVPGPLVVDSVGGQLTLSDLLGPLEIDSRNTDVRIDAISALKGPFRVNAVGGEIRVEGLRTEGRLDGRNTVIDVTLAAAAAITIYNLGEIHVTAPSGGYTLDAAATEGRIIEEEGTITPSEGSDWRAAGPVRGGGPTLTLRATRGTITVRKAAK